MSTYRRAWGLGCLAVVIALLAAGLKALITSQGLVDRAFWIGFSSEAVTNLLVAVVLALLLAAMAEVLRRRDEAIRSQTQIATRLRETDALVLALIGPVHLVAVGHLSGELDVELMSLGEAERLRSQLRTIESFSSDSFMNAMKLDEHLAVLDDESSNTQQVLRATDQLTAAFDLTDRADRLFAVRTISDDLNLLHNAELDPELRRMVGTLRRRAFEVALAARRTDRSLATSVGHETIAQLMTRVPRPLKILSGADGRAEAGTWREAISPATTHLVMERMQISVFLDTALQIVRARKLDGRS
ncbi:hypothetical protein ACLQ2Q_20985 [Microbacterium sp. DT81.1]|uniref:hypothetical protein n=1 Tax=Microbacterium sp. DT81.1 TaxID=3393413 RepID=UPI003CE71EB5